MLASVLRLVISVYPMSMLCYTVLLRAMSCYEVPGRAIMRNKSSQRKERGRGKRER